MKSWRITVAVALVAAAAPTIAGGAQPRPPYLAQAKPVWGDIFIQPRLDDRKYTYRGDYVLAIFDYDAAGGGARPRKTLAYTVCRTGPKRACVRRTWRGRPDIFMVYMAPKTAGYVGAAYRRYVDFAWYVGGRQRVTDRIWIWE